MSEETVKEKLIDEIEGLDWYHVNPKGELVHGSTSEHESYWKCNDVLAVIERVLQDGDKSSPSEKWVSVDERLPEKQHDWVLAACKLVPEGYYGVPHIAELRNGKWWSDDGKFPLIEIGVKVTHWQPLPKPPKGVQ